MAGIITRTAFTLGKVPQVLLVSSRGAQKMMADPLEHATGLERKEMEAWKRGNMDPFGMSVFKRGAGTKDNPNLIPSFHAERLIGCICHEDAFYIQYMWLHKGDPRRCECGHWFKLTEREDPFNFKD